MIKRKSPSEERSIILENHHKRPYGVSVRINLRNDGDIGYVEDVCVPLATGAFLTITLLRPKRSQTGFMYLIKLEGFPTAASAEAAGRRLVQALLWMAIRFHAPLRVDYRSYEQALVFSRSESDTTRIDFFVDGERSYFPGSVLGVLHDAFIELKDPVQELLLSMEIFCAASLETNQRAHFLGLVSALEPLAKQKQLGDEVDEFVQQCSDLLKKSSNIPSELKASLNGRLKLLRQESIRQALRRLVKETLPHQPEAWPLVDSAYKLRSEIIHSGLPLDLDTDLEYESQKIAGIIRDIYAKLLNTPLKF